MHKAISLVNILGFIALTSCATVPVNHFQGGKSLGTGKTKIGFGSQLGRNVDYDSDEDVVENPFSLLLDLSVQHGFGPKFDAGAELFVAMSSSAGIKIHGKYAFLDSTLRWGIALIPALGYSVGKNDLSSETRVNGRTTRKTEGSFTQKAFIAESALLVSYDFSSNGTLFFGPSLYYYKINSKGKTNDLIENTFQQTNFDRSIVSPGLSLGLLTEHSAFEVTLVPVKLRVLKDNETVEKTIWVPFFGVKFFGWGGLRKLFGLSD